MRLFVLALPFLFPGLLWADQCDRLPKPSVTFKRLDENVVVDTSHGHQELARMAPALAKPGTRLLGLTRGKAMVQFRISVPALIERNGRWLCASPQILVTFGLSPITVYVAREIPASSCAFDEIYRHELRHVGAYQDHLKSIEASIEDSLVRRFATGSSWRDPSPDIRSQLQQELKERWLPFIQNEINRGEADQSLIDSPEEYARVTNSCNGEVRKYGRMKAVSEQ